MMDDTNISAEEHTVFYLENCCFPSHCTANEIMIELSCKPANKYTAVSLINCPYLFFSRSTFQMNDVECAKRFVAKLPQWVAILDVSENRFSSEVMACFLPLLQRKDFLFLNLTRGRYCCDDINPRFVFERMLSDSEKVDSDEILGKIIFQSSNGLMDLPQSVNIKHSQFYGLYTHHKSYFLIDDVGEDYD